jgi:hypothetical protein
LAKLDKFFVNSSKNGKICVLPAFGNALPLQNAKLGAQRQRHISKALRTLKGVLA